MNITTVIRSELTNGIVVSTARIREGRSTRYETTIRVRGEVSDPLRSEKKADACVVHDRVCDYGYGRRTGGVSEASLDRFMASIG